jgi:hypothetical protein
MASTGINAIPPNATLLLLLPYIKRKSYKTSSNSRWLGKVEIRSNLPTANTFDPAAHVKNQAAISRSSYYRLPAKTVSTGLYTLSTSTPQR